MAEAEDLARAVVIEAARYGRSTVRLVHGASTTDRDGSNRTIKTAIRSMIDDGEFDRHVTSSVPSEGSVLLGISPAPRPVSGRVRLQDLQS